MKFIQAALFATSLASSTFHNASGETSLTIYNGGFGVVRETLPFDLETGLNNVSFSGVTSQMEPESVIIRDPSGKNPFTIIEQSYRSVPIDQEQLLEMFEGKTISFLKTIGDNQYEVDGKIIRAPGSFRSSQRNGRTEPIVEVEGKLITELPGKPQFPSLGDGSILKPTLSWIVNSDTAVKFDALLSYVTAGLTWKADYNFVLQEDSDDAALAGWITVDNRTGSDFIDAALKVLAGDVNRVVAAGSYRESAFLREDPFGPRSTQKAVQTKKFDSFHLYTIPNRVTLRDNETKQVEFLKSEYVKSETEYVYTGQGTYVSGETDPTTGYTKEKVAVYRTFLNTKENGLAAALPAGKIRFYRNDSDNMLEFVGENTIDHTPEGERVRVKVGNAFDLVVERKILERTDKKMRVNAERARFEIRFRNQSDKSATIQVIESPNIRGNWEISESSQKIERVNSESFRMIIELEPKSEKIVTYTAESN